MDAQQIHPLLSDRNRLMIITAVATSAEPIDFSTLLSTLKLTRGNLAAHLRKLEDAGLISCQKQFVDRVPRTTYSCTGSGRTAMRNYLKAVELLLKQV